ncbi:precorrin-3B synthase (plasmid) [Kovacikia minuta CCNUW1]|uniref:precorrin-3B synthase n=1 Tax=Kovacikia minuta TaxID=2931930 RepID=UPI001CCD0338|nr:precorrin-3B synthase [Kovacikia minuta]UBF29992.1 precorrin-3B synthase [Kovacikia minuta CCNUW1]
MDISIVYSLRPTGKEYQCCILNLLPVPVYFTATPAQDGTLSRIRIPGGILTVQQGEAIAQLAEQWGDGSVQITNRANVQIRGVDAGIPQEALKYLQQMKLAAPIAEVDAIRNIMGSPTAGIDRQQLLDTRPLIAGWNQYLIKRPDWAVLSPKFSVGFDGGEAVSVRDRPNDICLVAVQTAETVRFRLHLSTGERGAAPQDVGVQIKPEESLETLAALTEIYFEYTTQQKDHKFRRKPRFRELLNDWGGDAYLQAVAERLPFSWQKRERAEVPSTIPYAHLGLHPQRQPGFFYMGVVLPLGRLSTQQFRGLAALTTQFGNGTLRLTPWQNVLVSDIPDLQVATVQRGIEQLGLHPSPTHPLAAIVACSGTRGCQSSATDTQIHALNLANYLEQHIKLDRPINIHFSGCEKSCAQHHPSDITLLGMLQEETETYQIYVGDDGSKFGRQIYSACTPDQLPHLVKHMLVTYQSKRNYSGETFREFANRYTFSELEQLFENTENSKLFYG